MRFGGFVRVRGEWGSVGCGGGGDKETTKGLIFVDGYIKKFNKGNLYFQPCGSPCLVNWRRLGLTDW